jgi:hypothetical protein
MLGFIGCVVLPLQPAQVPRLSLEELVEHSSTIVHGRVTRTWMAWDAAHKYIWTHHEVAVGESLRGVPGSTVTVSEPGGTIGGVHHAFSGSLSYSAGEEVVLFLYSTPIGYLRATGSGQGKFTIDRANRARASIAGMELVDSPRARQATPLRRLEALNVREFTQRVREAVRKLQE